MLYMTKPNFLLFFAKFDKMSNMSEIFYVLDMRFGLTLFRFNVQLFLFSQSQFSY